MMNDTLPLSCDESRMWDPLSVSCAFQLLIFSECMLYWDVTLPSHSTTQTLLSVDPQLEDLGSWSRGAVKINQRTSDICCRGRQDACCHSCSWQLSQFRLLWLR